MSCSSGFGSHSLRPRNSSVSLFSRGCLCGPLLPAVYRPARNTGRQPRVCNLLRAAAVRRVSGCTSSGVVEGGATLAHAQRYEIALLCHYTVTVMPDTVCTCVCRPRLRPLRDLLPVVPAENGAQWSFICQARVAGLMAISLLASFNSPNYLFRVCSSVAACICSLNMLQARLLGRYWQESFVPDTSQTIRCLGSALSSFWCSYSSYSEDL